MRGASPAAGLEADAAAAEVECKVRMWDGKRAVQRLKSGAGKTVRDLTRMLVIVSSLARCGLNWYLFQRLIIMLLVDYIHVN